jgi:sulfate adenylyltransferase
MVAEDCRADELNRARTLKAVRLTSRELADLNLMAMGAYTPIVGFMGEADWLRVCNEMRLEGGTFWPVPLTLSVSDEEAGRIREGEDVALIDPETGDVAGVLEVSQKYAVDRILECRTVFRTSDPAHPGVKKVLDQGPINLGGRVRAFSEGAYRTRYADLCLRPSESRALFSEKGWSRVVAFQTRNPMHRSHEHLVKLALEFADGVLIHQVLGKLKDGDVPADVRIRAIDAMVENYFVPGTVVQAGYPIEMRYAGPREALLHALIRQNYGCSHLIVGRDHAGVGAYYGPFDAQAIFDTLWPEALKTKILKFGETFFCRRCNGMASSRTCPHDPAYHVVISGTRQRELLASGGDIPPEFSRPEVTAVLRAHYR